MRYSKFEVLKLGLGGGKESTGRGEQGVGEGRGLKARSGWPKAVAHAKAALAAASACSDAARVVAGAAVWGNVALCTSLWRGGVNW